jgi:nucleotidyltransferase substrate binding protein (TIGR01987 family)
MENVEDIRWKQRFQNFEKAIGHLEGALKIENPDLLQKAGIIQFFEMSYELAWNTLKDYLEDQGFSDVKSPRSAIKKAFEVELIENGRDWMELLLDRNLTAHTYDEEKATEVEKLIHERYFPLLRQLYQTLKQKNYA